MGRILLIALWALPAALPARAQTTPAAAEDSDGKSPDAVNPEMIRHQADDLRDAVASPSSTDFGIHDQASGFFEGLQRQTPVVVHPPRMDREPVDGHAGTVDGMIDTAQKRYDHYRLNSREVPDRDMDESIAYARRLRAEKRADFNHDGTMADNQMGVFRYAKASLEGGIVEVNGRMALMAARIGEAFAYATLIHEAAHARARAAGRLSPEQVIDGEVEAYRVQYQWIKMVDPSKERLIVLHVTLSKYLRLHPEDRATADAISYVSHLLQLHDTDGDEQKLREYVKKLGYEDGDHDHDGGVNPAATPLRV